MLIGLIADTHGLVRPDCAKALAGVELILHAGDVGGADVLRSLGAVAPVRAVWGNTDPPHEPGLSASIQLDCEGLTIHVTHGHELGSPTPERLLARYRADIIVFGHTHRAVVFENGARLAVNPGAAGPRRFRLVPSVARLSIVKRRAAVEIVPLR